MTDCHEFSVIVAGLDDGAGGRLGEPIQFQIKRAALEKLHGPIGAHRYAEIYRLHQAEIDAVARAYALANPATPEPMVLTASHFSRWVPPSGNSYTWEPAAAHAAADCVET